MARPPGAAPIGPDDEVARFASFAEAEVALSALRASGLDAVLLDGDPLTGAWREPYGQGGYRLGVARPDVPAARALLDDAARTPPESPITRPTPPDHFSHLRLILIGLLFLAIIAAVFWRGLF